MWFIDENENQLRTYTRKLTRMMQPEGIQIKPIFPPYRTKEEYISVLNDPETVCIVIDQRLKDTGEATYTGIELAQYLRGINKKLPIYILTNFAGEKEEFAGGEWSVEDIIQKDTLNDEKQAFIIKARILRHINIYEDILNERAKRFNELLRKSLYEELDELELQELEELQFERTAPTLAKEFPELKKLEQVVKTNEELLKMLNRTKDKGTNGNT